MYAKAKNITRFKTGGEELLKGIPLKDIRLIENFSYAGKRSDLAVLNGHAVIVLHNGLRQIILPLNKMNEFAVELAELAATLRDSGENIG
jgi:hypothetical protein